MREQIEVVYENGVLRPLGPIPGRLREHQHFTVTIEGIDACQFWPGADDSIHLDDVRRVLAKAHRALAEEVRRAREER
jgi:predicted DNA-binding antitoxin AbrB/MazE fold protein